MLLSQNKQWRLTHDSGWSPQSCHVAEPPDGPGLSRGNRTNCPQIALTASPRARAVVGTAWFDSRHGHCAHDATRNNPPPTTEPAAQPPTKRLPMNSVWISGKMIRPLTTCSHLSPGSKTRYHPPFRVFLRY